MKTSQGSSGKAHAFTGYQKFVIAVLAFLQFTIVLDFMILSPLGAILMPAMKISPSQFGLVVSVYAFSAGLSGLLAAGFADRFDRKKLLLFFYAGFILGTLFCALAPTYPFLLAARLVTGLFGGVIGSIVFAISTDLFPYQVRGRVVGFIQTAFAGSQVLGVPAGLFLANHGGWHMPFLMIVAVSTLVGAVIWVYLKPIDAHLATRIDRKALHHLWETLTTGRYAFAFATTAMLSTGGFMLMPFGSAYTVHNLGISMAELPMIYLVTGISAIVSGPLIGRLSDSLGKFNIFIFGSVVSIVMVWIYTRMSPSSLPVVILVNVLLFVGVFSRLIPSQALMSAIPSPENRGSFMAVSSSTQQISGGVASALAGLIVLEQPGGHLERFHVLGYVVIGAITLGLITMYYVNRQLAEPKHA